MGLKFRFRDELDKNPSLRGLPRAQKHAIAKAVWKREAKRFRWLTIVCFLACVGILIVLGFDIFQLGPSKIVFVPFISVPFLVVVHWLNHHVKRAIRNDVAALRCLHCGYDLDGTISALRDICPECGQKIPDFYLDRWKAKECQPAGPDEHNVTT